MLAGVGLGLPDPATQGLRVHAEIDGELLIWGFGSAVRYIRTARSRNSSEYFLGAAMVDVPLTSPI